MSYAQFEMFSKMLAMMAQSARHGMLKERHVLTFLDAVGECDSPSEVIRALTDAAEAILEATRIGDAIPSVEIPGVVSTVVDGKIVVAGFRRSYILHDVYKPMVVHV